MWFKPDRLFTRTCGRKLWCGWSTRACPSARPSARRGRDGSTTPPALPWSATPTTSASSAARLTLEERRGATLMLAQGTLSIQRSSSVEAAVTSARPRCVPNMGLTTWNTRYISIKDLEQLWKVTSYLLFQCRYCCSVAVFFCFGTTHFCNVRSNVSSHEGVWENLFLAELPRRLPEGGKYPKGRVASVPGWAQSSCIRSRGRHWIPQTWSELKFTWVALRISSLPLPRSAHFMWSTQPLEKSLPSAVGFAEMLTPSEVGFAEMSTTSEVALIFEVKILSAYCDDNNRLLLLYIFCPPSPILPSIPCVNMFPSEDWL